MKKTLFALLFLLPVMAHAQIINTVVGNGFGSPWYGGGFSGDNGYAISAELFWPTAVALDTAGNMYIADYGNMRVRKVTPSGIITTIAGSGAYGYGGDHAAATNAQLQTPTGVAVDKKGNVYISDAACNCIRRVDAAGIITTIAGSGAYGYGYYDGDSGLSVMAHLYAPWGIAVDDTGTIFFADQGNNRIRRIDTAGVIVTIAGSGNTVYGGDHLHADSAALSTPYAVAVDKHGNLFFTDYGNERIRKVDTARIITTIAGNGIATYNGDNIPADSASISEPTGLAVDDSGNVFISDMNNNRIRMVSASGIITTIAGSDIRGFSGDGGLATNGELNDPYGLAVNNRGNIFVADRFNNRIRIIGLGTADVHNITAVSGDIEIYPNPATTQLTVRSTNQPINLLTVTNLLGQTVRSSHGSTPLTMTTTSQSQIIDIADLPSGIYFVKVNNTVVRKFVKE